MTPGHDVRYAIWVWFAGSAAGDAMVSVTATPGTLSPTFTVCPWPGAATCPVAASGQPVELIAQVKAPQHQAGASLTLTATGVSPQAAAPATGYASVKIKGLPKPRPTATRTSPPPATSTPASAGVTVPPTLPPVTLPPTTSPASALPTVSLPPLPDPAASPALTPAAIPQPPPATPIQAANASAQFPVGPRQFGGQLAGLAVLAAAVTIAIARLSLRRPWPPKKRTGRRSADGACPDEPAGRPE